MAWLGEHRDRGGQGRQRVGGAIAGGGTVHEGGGGRQIAGVEFGPEGYAGGRDRHGAESGHRGRGEDIRGEEETVGVGGVRAIDMPGAEDVSGIIDGDGPVQDEIQSVSQQFV